MNPWVQLVATILVAAVTTLGAGAFFVGPQRRKYSAEATDTQVSAASKVSGMAMAQAESANARAQRAEAKADSAEARADDAERRVEALERDFRSITEFLARPKVTAALALSGEVMPTIAYLTRDTGRFDV